MQVKIQIQDKLALSVPEACALAGVKKDSLYREINNGRLRTAKINRRRVILKEALNEWLADREIETRQAMKFEGAVQ